MQLDQQNFIAKAALFLSFYSISSRIQDTEFMSPVSALWAVRGGLCVWQQAVGAGHLPRQAGHVGDGLWPAAGHQAEVLHLSPGGGAGGGGEREEGDEDKDEVGEVEAETVVQGGG